MVDNACGSDLRSYAYFFVVYFSCVTIRRWQEFIPTSNVQKSYFRDILFLLSWCRTVTVSRHPCCFADRSWIPVVCSVTSLTPLLSAGCVCHDLWRYKGQKVMRFMLAWNAWLIDPQNTEKQPFFVEKRADLRCFRIAKAWNAKQSVYHRGKIPFTPGILWR